MRFSKRDIELCPSGPATYKYTTVRPVDITAIRRLEDQVGNLEYFPTFARPFYRIHSREKKIQIRGVEGEASFTVVFMGRDNSASIAFLDATIESIPEPAQQEE